MLILHLSLGLIKRHRMKFRKIGLIIILLLTCISISSVPFLLSLELETTITLSLGIISSIGSVGTLIFAFLLYDRFGITSIVYEKKVAIVFELLEHLKGFGYSVSFYLKDIDGFSSIGNTFSKSMKHDESNIALANFDRMLKATVVVDLDDVKSSFSEFRRIYSNIWLPLKIKEELKILTLNSGYTYKQQNRDLAKLTFSNNVQFKKVGEGHRLKGELTYLEFIEDIEHLFKTIEKWIKKHTSEGIELNLNN